MTLMVEKMAKLAAFDRCPFERSPFERKKCKILFRQSIVEKPSRRRTK